MGCLKWTSIDAKTVAKTRCIGPRNKLRIGEPQPSRKGTRKTVILEKGRCRHKKISIADGKLIFGASREPAGSKKPSRCSFSR